MVSVVSLGCEVADVHHQYAAIHGALFGAASFRLVIAAMTGRTGKTYRGYLETLERLQVRLSALATQIPSADVGIALHRGEQLRGTLAEYVATLERAIGGLSAMCKRLLQDEEIYRHTPEGGQSEFNRDKIRDDRVLLQLERLGSQLNRLFSRF
jgi:hypothetical protein